MGRLVFHVFWIFLWLPCPVIVAAGRGPFRDALTSPTEDAAWRQQAFMDLLLFEALLWGASVLFGSCALRNSFTTVCKMVLVTDNYWKHIVEVWGVAQLTEGLPSIHKAPGLMAGTSFVLHACNSIVWEVEARRSGVQGHLGFRGVWVWVQTGLPTTLSQN